MIGVTILLGYPTRIFGGHKLSRAIISKNPQNNCMCKNVQKVYENVKQCYLKRLSIRSACDIFVHMNTDIVFVAY